MLQALVRVGRSHISKRCSETWIQDVQCRGSATLGRPLTVCETEKARLTLVSKPTGPHPLRAPRDLMGMWGRGLCDMSPPRVGSTPSNATPTPPSRTSLWTSISTFSFYAEIEFMIFKWDWVPPWKTKKSCLHIFINVDSAAESAVGIYGLMPKNLFNLLQLMSYIFKSVHSNKRREARGEPCLWTHLCICK